MRRLWRRHSLTIVLVAVFAALVTYSRLALVWWPGITDGTAPTWAWWTWETVVSNEADVFGAILLVLLTKHLRERGSPESGDEEEQQ